MEQRGNGTDCRGLLKPRDDGDGCEYSNWVYAFIAIVAIILAGIPFVVFICYLHRMVKKKQKGRGRTYSTGLESSSAYSYQPLHSDASGHTDYGTMDSSVDARDQSLRSPSRASSVSLTGSRASMLPNYDEVSLSHRNGLANKSPGSGADQAAQKTPGKMSSGSSQIISESQEKLVDQGGQYYDSVDVVSTVPKSPVLAVPKGSKKPPPKPPRQKVNDNTGAINVNPVYDEVERSDKGELFKPPSNFAPLINAPCKGPEDVKQVGYWTEGGDKGGSPLHAALDKPNANSTTKSIGDEEQKSQSLDEHKQSLPEQTCDSPQHADGGVHSELQKIKLPSKQKQDLLVGNDQQKSDPLTGVAAKSPPEKDSIALPPIPLRQNEVLAEHTGLLEFTEHLDQTIKNPLEKSPAKLRADYEKFLLQKVRTLPANERNGTFLIRDSVSSSGSKVLTVYAWNADSNKELYNFKVSVTEDGQAYLSKSARKFSNVNKLLEYLREYKDMLPCVLRTQVSP